MKEVLLYEPAMCCPTGLCGVSVDETLLRLSSLISSLEKKGVTVKRFSLSSDPQAFVTNQEINALITQKGVEALPATLVNGTLIKTSVYPTKEELEVVLGISLAHPQELFPEGSFCKLNAQAKQDDACKPAFSAEAPSSCCGTKGCC